MLISRIMVRILGSDSKISELEFDQDTFTDSIRTKNRDFSHQIDRNKRSSLWAHRNVLIESNKSLVRSLRKPPMFSYQKCMKRSIQRFEHSNTYALLQISTDLRNTCSVYHNFWTKIDIAQAMIWVTWFFFQHQDPPESPSAPKPTFKARIHSMPEKNFFLCKKKFFWYFLDWDFEIVQKSPKHSFCVEFSALFKNFIHLGVTLLQMG